MESNSFFNGDKEAYITSLTKRDVINSITIDDVKRFLYSLGVEYVDDKKDNILICPTICHNPIEEQSSMKLYWYQNNKVSLLY